MRVWLCGWSKRMRLVSALRRAHGGRCRVLGRNERIGGERGFSTLKKEWAKAKRGVALLKDEITHSKDLLLAKSGALNDQDRKVLAKTAKDLVRLLPALGVIALPAGSLLLPVMAKATPWALPSTFSYVESTPTNVKDTNITRRFRSQVIRALLDLDQRIRAQPTPNQPVLDQLNGIREKVTEDTSLLAFSELYELTEGVIMHSLDDDALKKILNRLDPQSNKESRDEIIAALSHLVSQIRSGDLALQDALDSGYQNTDDFNVAVKTRGLKPMDGEDVIDVLRSWLDITVVRSLPVMLGLFACSFEDI